jgi:hypothetical protein
VCLPAVDLDDEALSPPEEPTELVDGHVHFRRWKAVAAAEGEHPLFQLGAAPIRVGYAIERRSEKLRLPAGGSELGWGNEGTEVGEGARGCGHADASAGGITDAEGGGAVEDDALTLPEAGRSWHGDVDVCRFAGLG